MLRLANHSAHPFGTPDEPRWLRVNSDRPPATRAGIATASNGDEIRFVVGRPNGSDTRAVDLLVALEPGQRLEIDLAGSRQAPHEIGPPPANLGDLTCNGVPMQLVTAHPDGAAWTAHCRARIGRMLCVDVWLRHYPGEAWAHGECMVTCSNPAVPDLGETVPWVALKWGLAVIVALGSHSGIPNGLLIDPSTAFADGQARPVPFKVLWLTDATPLADTHSWHALWQVAGNGIASLYPQGNPILPPGFDAAAWMRDKVPEAVRRLHTWEPGITGGVERSNNSGEQGGIGFEGGECFAPNGVGCELVTYLSALEYASRPCNYLEASGEPLDLDAHPRLVMWDGRPHYYKAFKEGAVSPDQLGKQPLGWDEHGNAILLSPERTHGWWGPDVEHFFATVLLAACRLTGSDACQRILESWARVYLLQSTTRPGLSTSQPFATRATAWEMQMATGMHRELRNRWLAARVATHAQVRLRDIILPAYRGKAWWDIRVDDPRLGSGPWVICWQHAAAAYWLDVAGEHFGIPEARTLALGMARKLVAEAWANINGRWLTTAQKPVTGPWQTDPAFTYYGNALGPAVLLRHAADDALRERAESIMRQLRSEAREERQTRWLDPQGAR